MYCVFRLFFNWLLGFVCEIEILIYLGLLVGYGLLLVLYFCVWLDVVSVKLWFMNEFYVMVMWVKLGVVFVFVDVFRNMVLLSVLVFFNRNGWIMDVNLGFWLFWKVGGMKWINFDLVEFCVILYRLLYVLLNVWY